ncbi:MAG TPA: hypothetical protein VFQ38_05140 [Longimicrobiales bacterium]|nr:hypothetical protein [Longimicrobiales bacterium]
MGYRGVGLGVAAALLSAAGAVAQQPAEYGPARHFAGAAVIVAQPVGAFADNVDVGFGLGGHLLVGAARGGALALRLDAGVVNYGRTTKEVCFSSTVGCRVKLDLTTMNNIAYGQIGPQVMVPTGRVRPYANAGIGVSYFGTESSVKGTSGGQDDFARTTNFDDATFAWGAGGGLVIPVSFGRVPVSIDLGARYHGNGKVEYLREDGITDNPDGSISIHPTRSNADLVTYQVGVSIGLR